MSLQIVLTENAKLTLQAIFDSIEIKFGIKATGFGMDFYTYSTMKVSKPNYKFDL